MTNRFRHSLSAAGVGLLLLLALLGLAGEQAQRAQAPVGGIHSQRLPAERVAAYDRLLAGLSPRNQPYKIPPREDVVLGLVHNLLGPGASREAIRAATDAYYQDFYRNNAKESGPNPVARLGRLKQLELGQMAEAAGEAVDTSLAGTPEVLTVMLNFNGLDTYTSADPVEFNGVCLTDTVGVTVTVDGPRFNELPPPDDERLPWLDPNDSYTGGYTPEYVDLLMYSTTGYTQTMRPDVFNPWTGGMGFDYSGVSFRNWYAENSRGVYIPQGDVVEVTVPTAVSQFGAAACGGGLTDDSYYGPAWHVAISAAVQINIEHPSFDWTAWDQEDTFDYDNDSNFNEPDGYVDHFFLLEPGQSEGGEYGEFLIWPHSWDVNLGAAEGPAANQLGGYKVSNAGPLGGVWILNYTISDETGGLGTLVHEYGHDLGLPDNYSYGPVGSNPGFWDVMDSGPFGGGLTGMNPVNQTIWDKSEPYIGWNDPVVIDLSTTTAQGEDNAVEYTIGQQSKPPAGTVDGLRIVLPDIEKISFVEPYDSMMWYSDQGDQRDESIAKSFSVNGGETLTVTAQLAYDIEEDWDYLYWEISSTVTSGWVPLEVYSDTTELTTDTDPNGNNPSGNGITGSTDDWVTATAVITPGLLTTGTVEFRFHYFTDGATQGEGVYLDNISIVGSSSGTLVDDDAEGGDTWTHQSEGINTDNPWYLMDGTSFTEHSYLVEWRNSGEGTGFNGVPEKQAFETAGFDVGLNRMYWIDELDELGNIAHEDRFSQHTPGMLVWYANGSYSDNEIADHFFDMNPSDGAKGRVLLVDANPMPYYVEDEDGTRLLDERRSAFDAAFTLDDRPSFTLSSNIDQTPTDTITTIPGAMADPNFRDRIGSVPGYDENDDFIDPSAGVVIPTVDNVPYWAADDYYGDLGNPGLNAFGVNLTVVDQAPDGTWGRIKFWVDDDTVFVDKRVDPKVVTNGDTLTYTISFKDASGSTFDEEIQHTFSASAFEVLPPNVTLVPGSLTLTGVGTVYTTPVLADVQALGFDTSLVAAGSTIIVWVGELGGHRLDVPDAVVQYAVQLNGSGCFNNPTTLVVQQKEITDDFRNGGDPFLWPKHNLYTADAAVCPTAMFMPLISK